MFEPAEFLSLEHTSHAKLFESQTHVWDALKQITSYLQFRLKPAVMGELVGKPFISNAVFVGAGTIVEQGAFLSEYCVGSLATMKLGGLFTPASALLSIPRKQNTSCCPSGATNVPATSHPFSTHSFCQRSALCIG